MQRVPAYITDVQRKRLDAESESTGLGYAEIMRRALDRYLPASRHRPSSSKKLRKQHERD